MKLKKGICEVKTLLMKLLVVFTSPHSLFSFLMLNNSPTNLDRFLNVLITAFIIMYSHYKPGVYIHQDIELIFISNKVMALHKHSIICTSMFILDDSGD